MIGRQVLLGVTATREEGASHRRHAHRARLLSAAPQLDGVLGESGEGVRGCCEGVRKSFRGRCLLDTCVSDRKCPSVTRIVVRLELLNRAKCKRSFTNVKQL